MSAATTCFIRIGSYLTIPTMSHWDADKCTCSNIISSTYYQKLCNKINLLVSYLYFINETTDYFPQTLELASKAASLIIDDINQDEYLNQRTYLLLSNLKEELCLVLSTTQPYLLLTTIYVQTLTVE